MSRGPVQAGRKDEPRPGGWRDWQRRKPGKRETGLIGLSAAAIVSVYAVGYVKTGATGDEFATLLPADAPVADQAAAVAATPTATAQRGVAGAQQAVPTPTAAPAASAATSAQGVTYRDGTYVGVGSSRHGSIQATVVISGGKITSAAITSCGTRYPCSKVASLPAQTVALQAAPTNYVSGSTDSSKAYRAAVVNALSQAQVQQS